MNHSFMLFIFLFLYMGLIFPRWALCFMTFVIRRVISVRDQRGGRVGGSDLTDGYSRGHSSSGAAGTPGEEGGGGKEGGV